MRHLSALLCLCCALFLSSCTTLYVPSSLNVPLLSQKGEVSGHASLSLFGSGVVNMQAAYAATDHVGIMGNMMYNSSVYSYSGSNGDFTGNHYDYSFELAPGLYRRIGEGDDATGRIECYGGAGIARVGDNISSSYNFFYPRTEATYYKFFIQPSIGYVSPSFEAAFSVRFIDVQYTNIKSESLDLDGKQINFTSLDPMFTLKAGSPLIKAFVQIGFFYPAGSGYVHLNNGFTEVTGINRFNFVVGLNLKINNPVKAKKS